MEQIELNSSEVQRLGLDGWLKFKAGLQCARVMFHGKHVANIVPPDYHGEDVTLHDGALDFWDEEDAVYDEDVRSKDDGTQIL